MIVFLVGGNKMATRSLGFRNLFCFHWAENDLPYLRYSSLDGRPPKQDGHQLDAFCYLCVSAAAAVVVVVSAPSPRSCRWLWLQLSAPNYRLKRILFSFFLHNFFGLRSKAAIGNEFLLAFFSCFLICFYYYHFFGWVSLSFYFRSATHLAFRSLMKVLSIGRIVW